MCVSEYRIGIKILFLTVDCSKRNKFLFWEAILTTFGLIDANLDPIALWL